MRIARQLLLGAVALSRFTVAQDDNNDDEYKVHGNSGANNASTPHVREGNYTVHFVTVGKDTFNFRVQLSPSTISFNHANYLRSRTVFVLNQEIK
jgi:hypothetical protein